MLALLLPLLLVAPCQALLLTAQRQRRRGCQVDPSRMGVAGCSGGGVQAAYIAALDPRIHAASIACYTSTFAVDFAPAAGVPGVAVGGGGQPEGEQQWGPWLGATPTLDKPDLLVARAPRPTQVLLTTSVQDHSTTTVLPPH